MDIQAGELTEEIRDILLGYIKAQSLTGSKAENTATEFLSSIFSSAEYFSDTEGAWGTYPIANDPFGRSVFYALIRGRGNKTAVLMHHSDVVGTEDFGSLEYLAFSPDALADKLRGIEDSLSPDAASDLESGDFIFGRGSADMKGGGAIQIALMLELGKRSAELQGNVMLIAVPDEENLSAGMRAAADLLADYKRKFGFEYALMINSEPHQRKDYSRGVLSTGSVGKIMPFYYVRGSLAHISKVFEGINPIGILSELVRSTELNLSLSDIVECEAAPPPTWSYFRDRKEAYDVSMPLSAAGCFSILTLGRETHSVAASLRRIAEEAAETVYAHSNESYREYLRVTGGSLPAGDDRPENFPFRISVMSFDELMREAQRDAGDDFIDFPSSAKDTTAAERTFELLDFLFMHIHDTRPRIVYGLIPPWYPAVSNIFAPTADGSLDFSLLPQILAEYSVSRLGLPYETENFYTGISDLSYAGYSAGTQNSADGSALLSELMPLYGDNYAIPFESIRDIAMPVINIGPWGKDFHKMTERVLTRDVCVNTPALILEALRQIAVL